MHNFLEQYFKLVKRLLPSGAQGSLAGVDVGPGFCRMVELSPRPDGLELVRCYIGEHSGKDQAATIKRLSTEWGWGTRNVPVTAGIAGRGTLVRYIEMPRMSIKELRRAFALEADKYFPFPKDTLYTDCFILEMSSDGKRMSVLVAATKKELVDQQMGILKEGASGVSTVTLNSIAVVNAYTTLMDVKAVSAGKTVAIVDIGESFSTLIVLCTTVARFNRDIFIGTNDIVKRLVNMTGAAEAQARAMLNNKGEYSVECRQALAAVMGNLISELRISFDYFVTEKNMQIDSLALTGEGAIMGVEEIFRDQLDIDVKVWDPLAGVRVSAEAAAMCQGKGPLFTAVIGMALTEYDQG